MAYGGDYEVFFPMTQTSAQNILGTEAGSELTTADSSADVCSMMIPIPLVLYAVGAHLSVGWGTAVIGSLFIEREDRVQGTAVTIVEWDVDTATHTSGDDDLGMITTAGGSEDEDTGDIVFADSTRFPQTIFAPQYLTLRFVQTAAIVGEAVPFFIGRWLQIDYTPTSVFGKV